MFKSEKPLKFIKKETRQSQKGNPFTVVTLFDPESYDKLEFFASNDLVVNAGEGAIVDVYLRAEMRGWSVSFSCVRIEAVTNK